jgi:hypothetical protein
MEESVSAVWAKVRFGRDVSKVDEVPLRVGEGGEILPRLGGEPARVRCVKVYLLRRVPRYFRTVANPERL